MRLTLPIGCVVASGMGRRGTNATRGGASSGWAIARAPVGRGHDAGGSGASTPVRAAISEDRPLWLTKPTRTTAPVSPGTGLSAPCRILWGDTGTARDGRPHDMTRAVELRADATRWKLVGWPEIWRGPTRSCRAPTAPCLVSRSLQHTEKSHCCTPRLHPVIVGRVRDG